MALRKKVHILAVAAALIAAVFALQGCGGGGSSSGVSSVSGTIADIYRNPIVGARVWVDDTHQTDSLTSGAYKLDGVQSGWKTIRASATIDDKTWVGSTAAEILKNEPTMNIHIVLAPVLKTMEVHGTVVEDAPGSPPVSGARVLITTRLLATTPPESTDAYDGPYGSIVAVTDRNGDYRMDNVPVELPAVIAASKVGFYNNEEALDDRQHVDFALVPSALEYKMNAPQFEAIESYTMPDTITRGSDRNVYEAFKALTSPRYLESFPHNKKTLTRATPAGSLIEIDLYFNALEDNDSTEVAGCGIYRKSDPSDAWLAIDFVRDPYANFYGDAGLEITPDSEYYYCVTAVDMEFLDADNQPDENAESDKSSSLSIQPLGQLRAGAPAQEASVDSDVEFTWSALNRAAFYKVFVYDRFPTLVPDPSRDYPTGDPPVGVVDLPIWPSTLDSNENRTSTTSIHYTGPALESQKTYYWFVMAKDESEMAVSYSELRHFTVR